VPKGLKRVVRDHLEKARAAALAAVEAYNKPGSHFRTAHYIVMMTMAWTALFHAIFFKDGRRPWHRKKKAGKGVHYVHVDGEPKHWELSECPREYWVDKNPPERANLQFLVGLRHKIEHRHLPELDATLYGECQAALMNFDELLATEFGTRYSLNESLAFSLQFSKSIPPQRATALRRHLASVGRGVLDFIDRFRNHLPDELINDQKYSFRVYLVPKVTTKPTSADVAVEFVPYDPKVPGEAERLKRLTALIKERQVPVANLGFLKASQVAAQVRARKGVPFNLSNHVNAWQHYEVRPGGGSEKPEKTKAKYCVYDTVHKDYVYTQEWVELLCKELADPAKYEAVTGRTLPQAAPQATQPVEQSV
jgi:uncharacterized protein DUF3644